MKTFLSIAAAVIAFGLTAVKLASPADTASRLPPQFVSPPTSTIS